MNAAPTTSDETAGPGLLAEPGDWPDADDVEATTDAEDPVDALVASAATPAGAADAGPAASDDQMLRWMGAIVGRDERALAAMYDATFTRVFGLVQRIVRNTALADEVVEDAYFQVWRQAVRFDPERGRAMTWLLAMARSRAIDALRREARFRHDALDDEALHDMAADAPPADELLALAQHRADLHQALMLLGAQPRQLLSMAFFRGLSHEEIAEQTRLPLGTVKSHIRRALLSLRQILGPKGAPVLAS